MRSTPTPYETLRTVKVELRCPRFLRITTPSKIWMRSLSPSLIFVCTRTVSPTRNSGICPRTSGLTFRCSTSSIAFERIFAPSSDYRSPKNNTPSSLLPGVLRPLQEPVRKALGVCGELVAQHTGHQPCDRLDHRQRRDLAAGEHEVA